MCGLTFRYIWAVSGFEAIKPEPEHMEALNGLFGCRDVTHERLRSYLRSLTDSDCEGLYDEGCCSRVSWRGSGETLREVKMNELHYVACNR